MYLKDMNILNYGCINNLNYSLPFKENGSPKPVIFIGKNGTGKTLILANIIHSLIEFKKQVYTDIPESTNEKYYRVLSKKYILNGKNFSYINYNFSNNIQYTDLMSISVQEYIDKEYKPEIHQNINVADSTFNKNGFLHNFDQIEESEFQNNVFLYFPVDRYYIPTWLNAANPKLELTINDSFIGINNVDMIKNNILSEIETWILDLIIDMFLYERKYQMLPISGGNQLQIIIHEGKNNNIINKINEIITEMFKANITDLRNASIGISTKENRKIEITFYMDDGRKTSYVPNFSNLSSGEIMLLGIFCSILKEYDRIAKTPLTNFSDIKGIVIIDEADIHLHSDFAKDILPKLIKIFINIQFLISSHSPFFLLGMKEQFGNDCEFVYMPTGTIVSDLENFEEIKKCYIMMDKGYERLINDLEKVKFQIEENNKPLIITEGKTDWKHLKKALQKFKIEKKFEDLDISFLEYNDDLGDSLLESLLKNIAKIPQNKRIVGLFDNDEAVGKSYDKDEPTNLKNNVFAWCIPNPRNLPFGISIEFLYEDNDIRLTDNNGRRLYLSNEFNEKSLKFKDDITINTTNKKVKDYYKTNKIKIIDSEVYDVDENSIALSKDAFADNIVNDIQPFNNVNFVNFEKIFEKIQYILNLPV